MSGVDAPIYTRALAVARLIHHEVSRWCPAAAHLYGVALVERGRRVLESAALALTFPASRDADIVALDRALATLRVEAQLVEAVGVAVDGFALALAEHLDEIGRMVGGWQRRRRRARADESTRSVAAAATTASTAAGRTGTTPTGVGPPTGTGGTPTTGTTITGSGLSAPSPEPAAEQAPSR